MFFSIRKILSKALRWGIGSLLYTVFILPLQLIVPKKRNSIVVIGKYGQFNDNVKYIFLYLHNHHRHETEVSYIIKDYQLYKSLKAVGLPVLYHPTPKSILTMVRASVVFVAGHIRRSDYLCCSQAKFIQLWHGAGMKKGSLKNKRIIRQHAILHKVFNAFRFFPTYDVIISTSPFYTKNVFSTAFNAKEVVETGFPRNDCLFREAEPFEMLGTDSSLINRVKEYKQSGYKIVLYAPTFRDTGGDAMVDQVLDLDKLSEFGEYHKLIFVFKMHPAAKATKKISEYRNVWEYDRSSDVYPLFHYIDVLITDYSSIYMDYTLLDRPIVFFPYDYKKYIQQDRDIRFDYDWITPGQKCYNQSELQNVVAKCLLSGEDTFQSKRREIADIAFFNRDGLASNRIWDYIEKNVLDK